MTSQYTFYEGAPAPKRPPPSPYSDLVSPEVLPDGRVTFRIYAPKATEVSAEGEWIRQGLGAGGPLVKDDEGVWSLTVGPLPPDFYTYAFTVDGVRTMDPQNTAIKPGNMRLENMFLAHYVFRHAGPQVENGFARSHVSLEGIGADSLARFAYLSSSGFVQSNTTPQRS